ncbi:MAG: ABC transporter ATP-binding protein [Lachnospiraceae bacterium]|nr:ABC transporter ATP-binding protein [Lachnospiraceae bacterium]MEE0958960.1 ABC transporter ATP-binding protein [Lachnospiraceae bacterium]
MLNVTNVNKQLGDFRLNNINLTLEDGYIMGLIGANGSGKTSLIRLLCGLTKSDSGSIAFDNLHSELNEDSYKQNIGYVASGRDHGFFDKMSLDKNAHFFGKFYNEYDHKTFLQYAKDLELNINKDVFDCSDSELIRFEFAFAMSHNARLLILDEPNGSFDDKLNRKFAHILRKYINEHMACAIIATHITEELDNIADYITMINNGNIVFSKDIETLLDDYFIIKGDRIIRHKYDKQDIIFCESNEYGTTVFIKNNERTRTCSKSFADGAVKIIRPAIEDILFYMIKGGYNHA